eukprot:5666758-Prymnesium_polylepis.1
MHRCGHARTHPLRLQGVASVRRRCHLASSRDDAVARTGNSPLVAALPWQRRYRLLSQKRSNDDERIDPSRAEFRERRAFDALWGEYRFAAHVVDVSSGDTILTETKAELDVDRSIWVCLSPENSVLMPEHHFREAEETDAGWAPAGTLAVSIFVERRGDGALTMLASFNVDLADFEMYEHIDVGDPEDWTTLFGKQSKVLLPSLWEPLIDDTYEGNRTNTGIAAELYGARVAGARAWRLSRLQFGFFWGRGTVESFAERVRAH